MASVPAQQQTVVTVCTSDSGFVFNSRGDTHGGAYSTFTECAYGIPANVQILYPELGLHVDIAKTKEVVQLTRPLYWPADDER